MPNARTNSPVPFPRDASKLSQARFCEAPWTQREPLPLPTRSHSEGSWSGSLLRPQQASSLSVESNTHTRPPRRQCGPGGSAARRPSATRHNKPLPLAPSELPQQLSRLSKRGGAPHTCAAHPAKKRAVEKRTSPTFGSEQAADPQQEQRPLPALPHPPPRTRTAGRAFLQLFVQPSPFRTRRLRSLRPLVSLGCGTTGRGRQGRE